MRYVVGVILILIGVGWFVITGLAAGMASRATTRSENLVPFLGVAPILLGIAIMTLEW